MRMWALSSVIGDVQSGIRAFKAVINGFSCTKKSLTLRKPGWK